MILSTEGLLFPLVKLISDSEIYQVEFVHRISASQAPFRGASLGEIKLYRNYFLTKKKNGLEKQIW